eukprot:15331791-Ditylum_brightwellii.AAC.1
MEINDHVMQCKWGMEKCMGLAVSAVGDKCCCWLFLSEKQMWDSVHRDTSSSVLRVGGKGDGIACPTC